jgi:hypothetical protein
MRMQHLSETVLNIANQEFNLAVGALMGSIVLVFIILRIRQWQKAQQEKIVDLLNDYIVADEDNTLILEFEMSQLLRNRYNRQPLIDEMVNQAPQLTEASFEKVHRLYHKLGLSADAIFKIERGNWFLIAKGLREIGAFKQVNHTNTVLQHLDTGHEIVVLEAQKALISLYGFKGLHYFKHLTTPLSNWSQVCLLSVLSQQISYSPSAIRSLTQSSNPTLVLFGLAILRRFELSDLIAVASGCLQHVHPEVTRTAAQTIASLRAAQSRLDNPLIAAEADALIPAEYYTYATAEDAFSEAAETTFFKVEALQKSVGSIFNSIPALLLYPRAMLLAK